MTARAARVGRTPPSPLPSPSIPARCGECADRWSPMERRRRGNARAPTASMSGRWMGSRKRSLRGDAGQRGPWTAAARRRTGAIGGGGDDFPRDGAPDAHKTDLKPGLGEQWCLASMADPDVVWHWEDELSVDERPPDPDRPVVGRDATSRPLLADTRPPLPAVSGHPVRHGPNLSAVAWPTASRALERMAGGGGGGGGERPTHAVRRHPLRHEGGRRPLSRRRADRADARPPQPPLAGLPLRRFPGGGRHAAGRQTGSPPPAQARLPAHSGRAGAERAAAPGPAPTPGRPGRDAPGGRGSGRAAQRPNPPHRLAVHCADARINLRRLSPAFEDRQTTSDPSRAHRRTSESTSATAVAPSRRSPPASGARPP